MNKQALYFPYIRVPEAAWFTRTLLYWDRVGTIVPYALADSRKRLGDYTFELIGAHLVEPIYPDAHVNMIPRFAEGFFELLATDTMGAEERRVGFERGHLTLIHFDKMGKTVADELEARGLAHSAGRTDSPNSWWNVESRTADIFMTISRQRWARSRV